MRWVIFYSDGTRYSDQDGAPNEAPPTGALVLWQYNFEGRSVLYSKDTAYCYGWRAPNEWVPCDIVGVIDYLTTYRGVDKAVIFGRWARNDNFDAVWAVANEFWLGIKHGPE